MFVIVLAHNPLDALSNLERRWSYNALRSKLVLPSASTLSNICRSAYSLTVDAIRNQFAIMLVIAYYMNRIKAFQEVQLAFDEVDGLFFSYLDCESTIIGQGSTYWSTASHTFERRT
jgi:hypothetical protein